MMKHLEVEVIIAAISVALFVAGLVAIPWLVRRLPPDYFVRPAPRRSLIVRVLRNVIGIVAIVAGVAMLVLPGPGIVALVMGLTIIDLPVKQKILRKLFEREKIQEGLQKLRSKAGKQPFVIPQPA
jgi:hypothetical protein